MPWILLAPLALAVVLVAGLVWSLDLFRGRR